MYRGPSYKEDFKNEKKPLIDISNLDACNIVSKNRLGLTSKIAFLSINETSDCFSTRFIEEIELTNASFAIVSPSFALVISFKSDNEFYSLY